VVCNSRTVIGIIELKYQPKVQPQWQKDLDTMEWAAANREGLSVQNKRYKGIETDGRTYPLSPHTLFVWAGIHAKTDSEINGNLSDRLTGGFMELHAETRANEAPEVWTRG